MAGGHRKRELEWPPAHSQKWLCHCYAYLA